MRRLALLLVVVAFWATSCVVVQGRKPDAADTAPASQQDKQDEHASPSAQESHAGTSVAPSEEAVANPSETSQSASPSLVAPSKSAESKRPPSPSAVASPDKVTSPEQLQPCQLITAADMRSIDRDRFATSQRTVTTRSGDWLTTTCEYGTDLKILFAVTIDTSAEHQFWQHTVAQGKTSGSFQWVLNLGDDAFRSTLFTRAVRKGTIVMTFSTNGHPMWDKTGSMLADIALTKLKK